MSMKENNRPGFEAGEVLAIKLNPQEYGYFRINRSDIRLNPSGTVGVIRVNGGRSIGVIPVISNGLVSKVEELNTITPRWFFNFGVSPADQERMIKIGKVEFADSDDGWPPPRFLPPSPFRPFFEIDERGRRRRATESETKGLQKFKTFNPEALRRFISESRAEFVQQQGHGQEVTDEASPSGTPTQGEGVFLEIVFKNKDFPYKGRDVVEDALADALENNGIGEVTGAGSGPKTTNVDVEVSDIDRGLDIIRRTLRAIKVPASTEIHQSMPVHTVHHIYD